MAFYYYSLPPIKIRNQKLFAAFDQSFVESFVLDEPDTPRGCLGPHFLQESLARKWRAQSEQLEHGELTANGASQDRLAYTGNGLYPLVGRGQHMACAQLRENLPLGRDATQGIRSRCWACSRNVHEESLGWYSELRPPFRPLGIDNNPPDIDARQSRAGR